MDNPASHYIGLAAVVAALIGLSAFFSVCETGFTSLSKIKLKGIAARESGRLRAARARLALGMLESYDRLLSAVLIGNTLVNMAASALAAMLFIELLGPGGVTVATLAMTLIVLVFAEISPKTLAKESPESAALAVAPALRAFMFAFAPLCRLAGAWKKIIAGIFLESADRSITEDELLTFVGEARQEGGINRREERMIRQAIEFDEMTAAEIATPRVEIEAVSERDSPEAIDAAFERTGFSRLPVYRDSIDSITGVILLRDFHFEVIGRGRPPGEIVKPALFVAKTMKVPRLLRALQEKKSSMAVLVDEFGGTLGIVTLEDIVEELVGEIWDEHDSVREPLRENPDGSFTALGKAPFRDLLEFIEDARGGAVAGSDAPPGTTVGNWVMEKAGGLPSAGEEFAWRSLSIRVSRVKYQRVMEVVVEARGGREGGER